MLFTPTILAAVVTTFIGATIAQTKPPILAVATTKGTNSTNIQVLSLGVYQILSANIYQRTVNVSAALPILTTQEDFAVTVQSITNGALPVQCNASWLTLSVTYPAVIALDCADPAVNVTLLQGEVWPEYGGFFLFVELNEANPAAWMVGNHISSAPGWRYQPISNDTWPPSGHWGWTGDLTIDSMPSVSLQHWIGFNFTDR